MAKLRFGYFIAPFHRAGTNPTLALRRDLEFVEHLDALGFDEAWIGEHHSAGTELIASPEIFIAAAAERTKWIKLCTGVISLAYHNPLWVADRLMMLDHLTHGRVIGGVGPGSLPSDSSMIGLTPTDTRELLETNLDIVVRLLAGETVSAKTATHQLFDAKLQLSPYSDGGVPLERGAALAVFLGSSASNGITGKLLSAVWDPWNRLPDRIADLRATDVYTLRRIVPRDRNLIWEDGD